MRTILTQASTSSDNYFDVDFMLLYAGDVYVKWILDTMTEAAALRSVDQLFVGLLFRDSNPNWYEYTDAFDVTVGDNPAVHTQFWKPVGVVPHRVEAQTITICPNECYWRAYIKNTGLLVISGAMSRELLEEVYEQLERSK